MLLFHCSQAAAEGLSITRKGKRELDQPSPLAHSPERRERYALAFTSSHHCSSAGVGCNGAAESLCHGAVGI